MIITNIKEASVYRSGAYITRYGNVKLPEGRQTITVEIPSPSIDPNTLTATFGQGIRGLNVRPYLRNEEQKKELQKEILEKLEEVKDRIQTYADQIEILKNNTDFSARENMSVKEMNEYIDSLPERTEKIREKIRSLKKEETDLVKQQQDIQKKSCCYLVDIDLECEKEGEYPLRLRYYEYSASWSPFYEIRTGEEEKASLRLRASIRQNSSEDWKGVSLKLFTGDPSVSANIPVLSPQYVNFYEPPIYGARRTNAAFGSMMKATMDMAVEEEADMEEAMIEVRNDQATASQNDTMMEYDLDSLYDLDDRKELSIDLTSSQIDCRYHVIALPKADSYGYLAAEVKTSDISEIIDSSAKIYHNDTFIGDLYIDVDPGKETYDISLGKDETIRLKRTQKKKYRSNVLLKGQTKDEYEYEIEVVSRKNKKTDITLLDQIPVSRDKTIVVDVQTLSGAHKEEETGELEWDFTLEPNEKKTFTISYSLSWPKDKKLNI